MRLLIRFASLHRFQLLYDSNEFIRSILSQTRSNIYFVETEAVEKLRELERLLKGKGIKYDLTLE